MDMVGQEKIFIQMLNPNQYAQSMEGHRNGAEQGGEYFNN